MLLSLLTPATKDSLDRLLRTGTKSLSRCKMAYEGAGTGGLLCTQQSCASGGTHLAMTELRCGCCKSRSREALLEGGVAAALPQEVEALASAQQGLCQIRRHKGRPDYLIQSEAVPPQAPSDSPLCGTCVTSCASHMLVLTPSQSMP